MPDLILFSPEPQQFTVAVGPRSWVLSEPRAITVRTGSRSLRLAPEPQRFTIAVSDRVRVFTERQPLVALVTATGPRGPIGLTGPVGPIGPIGGVAVITVDSPNTTWILNHNLGFKPNISTFTPTGDEIVGVVSHTNVNTAEVRFNILATGVAILT